MVKIPVLRWGEPYQSLENDKVVESWAQMEIAKLMQQLGVGGQV